MQTVALIFTESLIKIPVLLVSVLMMIFEMTREIEAIRWTIVECIVLSELATK